MVILHKVLKCLDLYNSNIGLVWDKRLVETTNIIHENFLVRFWNIGHLWFQLLSLYFYDLTKRLELLMRLKNCCFTALRIQFCFDVVDPLSVSTRTILPYPQTRPLSTKWTNGHNLNLISILSHLFASFSCPLLFNNN